MMKRSKAFLVAVGFAIMLAQAALPAGVFAAEPAPPDKKCDVFFLLTIPAWYNGISRQATINTTTGSSGQELDCEIAPPSAVGGIGAFIWRIVLNIVEMMLNLVGYASVAFIIYGGYKYIYGAGSPDKMVSARKTILNAVVGLIISIMSIAIVNTIAGSITK